VTDKPVSSGHPARRWLAFAGSVLLILLAACLSFAYGMAFMYTHPIAVWSAMAVCVVLLTAPLWIAALSGWRRLLIYYLAVVIVLVCGVLLRFVVQVLL
jgi:hypothetical protein